MEIQVAAEVALLSVAYYFFIRHLQTTRGGGLLAGIFVLLIVGIVLFLFLLEWLQLEHIRWIGTEALPALAFSLLIIFQPELRLAITRLGSIRLVRMIERLFGAKAPVPRQRVVDAIVGACGRMSRSKTGALIVLEQRQGIEGFASGGQRVNAETSTRLLENIFYKGAPLHDGAVFIIKGRIAYAASHLPSAPDSEALPKELGTRHRAAVGLSEESDALVIVVSEETGRISLARKGELMLGVTLDELRQAISAGLAKQSDSSDTDDVVVGSTRDDDDATVTQTLQLDPDVVASLREGSPEEARS